MSRDKKEGSKKEIGDAWWQGGGSPSSCWHGWGSHGCLHGYKNQICWRLSITLTLANMYLKLFNDFIKFLHCWRWWHHTCIQCCVVLLSFVETLSRKTNANQSEPINQSRTNLKWHKSPQMCLVTHGKAGQSWKGKDAMMQHTRSIWKYHAIFGLPLEFPGQLAKRKTLHENELLQMSTSHTKNKYWRWEEKWANEKLRNTNLSMYSAGQTRGSQLLLLLLNAHGKMYAFHHVYELQKTIDKRAAWETKIIKFTCT